MADYEPLDISQWCNAGVSELGDGAEVPVGRQTMRGLPFLVGSDGAGSTGNVYIALDGSQEPLSVPIGRPARRVVLAHRMLETKVGDGGPTGRGHRSPSTSSGWLEGAWSECRYGKGSK